MKNLKVIFLLGIMVCGLVFMCGCTGTESGEQTPAATSTVTSQQTQAAVEEDMELLIATTTSLDATGLLEVLEAEFEEMTDANVDITAVGTGTALEYGRNGDVDLIMVHDRAREDAFIEDGSGTDRRVFAYNYFVIVGPESDPAGIQGMKPEDAFAAILEAGKTNPDVKFVSRGDSSGTHSKEKAIWKTAGYDYNDYEPQWVKEDWYVEAGTGMGGTLTMADEMSAYTLSDIGTYLKYKGDGTIDLAAVVDEGDALLNIYAEILVNPEKYPDTNVKLAAKWMNFMISDDVQDEIREFGVDRYGEPLFFPAIGNLDILSPAGVTQSEISESVTA